MNSLRIISKQFIALMLFVITLFTFAIAINIPAFAAIPAEEYIVNADEIDGSFFTNRQELAEMGLHVLFTQTQSIIHYLVMRHATEGWDMRPNRKL